MSFEAVGWGFIYFDLLSLSQIYTVELFRTTPPKLLTDLRLSSDKDITSLNQSTNCSVPKSGIVWSSGTRIPAQRGAFLCRLMIFFVFCGCCLRQKKKSYLRTLHMLSVLNNRYNRNLGVDFKKKCPFLHFLLLFLPLKCAVTLYHPQPQSRDIKKCLLQRQLKHAVQIAALPFQWHLHFIAETCTGKKKL